MFYVFFFPCEYGAICVWGVFPVFFLAFLHENWTVTSDLLGVQNDVKLGFQDPKQPNCIQNKARRNKTNIGLMTGIGLKFGKND